jgi:small conductance mechanosensitive channel
MGFILQGATWYQWTAELAGQIRETVHASINSLVTGLFGRLPYLLAGLIVLVIFWLLSRFIRYIFLAGTRRAHLDARLRILISRMIVVVVLTLGIFTALTVIIPTFDLGSVIAGLGFSSFVIGFAAKDILNNFFSGVLILWQQPFHIGDHVFVGNNQGKVEYIGVRATSLRKDDGELILIPNGDMYSTALTIRGAGAKRRMALRITTRYGEDIAKLKRKIFQTLAATPGIVAEPRPNVLVTDLAAEGAVVTVNFWINTNESKPLEVFDRAAVGIIDALGRSHISVFPPQTVAIQPEPDDPPRKKEDPF